MKNIAILGSTGSIGTSTLEVISDNRDRFNVVALAARNNIRLLEEQILEFNPEIVAVFDEDAGRNIMEKDLPVKVVTGGEGILEVATLDKVDMVVSAIVGSDGLIPTYEAIRAGKEMALATKEALVMAGHIIMKEASDSGVKIIPVDSEHSAVFQCLEGRDMKEVEKIILTASGGAFYRRDVSELENVTPGEALKHPNWDMGRKITIDSATLMNKGLEVIEAYWLFGLPLERIGVVLHPQSIIHSMVCFIDGSMIAHMSVPDMKGPISYALAYPERIRNVLPLLDIAGLGKLTFDEPDSAKYPSLDLTYNALRTGGTMPCVMNAANEVAVKAFLNEKIKFTDINSIVSRMMDEHNVLPGNTIGEILDVNEWAHRRTQEVVDSLC